MSARVLYELALQAAVLTRGSGDAIIVNDRFDVARAAGADGVQLTASSLPANLIREIVR